MDIVVLLSASLIAPVLGVGYLIVGESKRRMLRSGTPTEFLGFGRWYVDRISTFPRLGAYFWVFFQAPYVVPYLLSVLLDPTFASAFILWGIMGFFLSTVGSVIAVSGIRATWNQLESVETPH